MGADDKTNAAINANGGWCNVAIDTSDEQEPLIEITDIEGGHLFMGVPEAWEVVTKLMHAMSICGTPAALMGAYRGGCTVEFHPTNNTKESTR